MNWIAIEESPSHVVYDTTMYHNWYDDCDDSWDDWDPDYYEYWYKMWHGPFTSK